MKTVDVHVCVLFAWCLTAASGEAQSSYCRKTQARAEGDAALLAMPRLTASALRFPSAEAVELGPTLGDGYQIRVGVSASLTDIARSAHVRRIAQADCEQHEHTEP